MWYICALYLLIGYIMFEITDLTAFNPALVYAFNPEPTLQEINGSTLLEDTLFAMAEQYQDIFSAYMHAQNEILPLLKEGDISAETFLQWIDTLHRLSGQCILQSYGYTAGQYTQEYSLGWRNHSGLQLDFASYLSSDSRFTDIDTFVAFLKRERGVDEKDGAAFVALLQRIEASQSIKLTPLHLVTILKAPREFQVGTTTLVKLIEAYNTQHLTAAEKAIVKQIVTISRSPEQIVEEMKLFARNSLQAYKSCNPENRDEVARFIATTFYQFTELHPYPNANGRTATCLINIFLQSFGLPSILLCKPGDTENQESDYFQAIEQLSTTQAPLEALIKRQIEEAEITPFHDEATSEMVALILKATEIMKRLKNTFPEFNIQLIDEAVDKLLDGAVLDTTAKKIAYLKQLIETACGEEKKCLEPYANQREAELVALSHRLNRISGQSGWRAEQQEGLCAWLEMSDMSTAKACSRQLKKVLEGIATVKLTQRVDNKKPVIMCENINERALCERSVTNSSVVDHYSFLAPAKASDSHAKSQHDHSKGASSSASGSFQ